MEQKVILGRDFSGTIVEVGLHVEGLKVGDGVWSALPLAVDGALCDHIVLPASQVKDRSQMTSPKGGCHFYDAMYEGLSNTVIIA